MDASTSTSSDRTAAVALTDQARLAVHVGRSLGGQDGRGATVAHLVAGIAGEPDGMAGALLRQRFGEVGPRIAVHPDATAGALPALDVAFVALPVTDRPAWSLELLVAALRVGGEDLAHLLESCGVSLPLDDDELVHRMPGAEEAGEVLAAPETFGRMGLLDHGFSREADLAVARSRARAGDSRDLLAWLEPDEATLEALSRSPGVGVDEVVARAVEADGSVGTTDLVTAITQLVLRRALGG